MLLTRPMMGAMPVQMMLLSATLLAAAYAAILAQVSSQEADAAEPAPEHKGHGKGHGHGEAPGEPKSKGWPAINMPIPPKPKDFQPEPQEGGDSQS
jgi:hypothetical protein